MLFDDTLDSDRAIACYQKAIQIFEQKNMKGHPVYTKCHEDLGVVYYDMGKKDEAVQLLEFAITIYEKSIGKNHTDYQRCLKNLDEMKSKK